jgi:hypothetical protein
MVQIGDVFSLILGSHKSQAQQEKDTSSRNQKSFRSCEFLDNTLHGGRRNNAPLGIEQRQVIISTMYVRNRADAVPGRQSGVKCFL